jgi:hypothetical protein
VSLEGAAANEKPAWVVPTRLISDRGHPPITECPAVEERLETLIGDKARRSNDVVASSACQRDAREHRIGRPDSRIHAGPHRIQVLSMMEAASVVGHTLRRVGSCPQRPGFMVGAAQALPAALDRLHGMSVGE